MRQVVKVGSSSLYNGAPNLEVFSAIAGEVVARHEAGIDMTMVTSGAIAMGCGELGYESRDAITVQQEQLAASVGQRLLMDTWSEAYGEHGYIVGQLLGTKQALVGELPEQQDRITDLFATTFAFNRRATHTKPKGVIQIGNENDAADITEIERGDNDNFSAYVGNLVCADALFLLGTSPAILECPKAPDSRIATATLEQDGYMLELICGPTDDPQGTGGADTKLEAAQTFLGHDNDDNRKVVYIASAQELQVMARAEQGDIGTMLKRAA